MTLEQYTQMKIETLLKHTNFSIRSNKQRGQSTTFFIDSTDGNPIYIIKFFDYLKGLNISSSHVSSSSDLEHLFELLEEDDTTEYSVDELINVITMVQRCFDRYIRVTTMDELDCFPQVFEYESLIKLNSSYYGCLIEAFVPGQTLEEVIRNPETNVSPTSIYDFIFQMATIIKKLQFQEIVHRDISPDNIMYHNDQYILIDPGVVKIEGIGHETRTGMMIGKFFYCSPEQAHGNSKTCDFTSDLYAVGIIALEMALGENYLEKYYREGYPYYHTTLLQRFEREIEDKFFTDLPENPFTISLFTILKKLIQIEKHFRFDSVDTLLELLKSIKEE
ncbi:protein kinase [Exiguobacterium indicum]|uniref:serine/threonine protein kinase n=1 Tax=Exiguobacterium indicum TaxID=296995 RepID=UPI00398204DD